MGHVVQLYTGQLAAHHEIHIDRRRREQCLTVCAFVTVTERRLVALRKSIRNQPAQAEAVGLHAGRRQEDDGIAILHLTRDALGFGRDLANGRAGQDDRGGIDDALERRGLAPTPDGASPVATFGPAVHERLHASGVGKPARVTHRRMHRDGNRPRAACHKVVHDRRDRIDGDLVVETPAGLGVHRIGHEVLGPEAFLDVSQIMICPFNQVSALAACRRRLGIAVGGEFPPPWCAPPAGTRA